MKVRNLNGVSNQYLYDTVYNGMEGTMFQSYDSNIAFMSTTGLIILGKNWDYSKTTGKYRNIFLGETKKETERKLVSGEYKYDENL